MLPRKVFHSVLESVQNQHKAQVAYMKKKHKYECERLSKLANRQSREVARQGSGLGVFTVGMACVVICELRTSSKTKGRKGNRRPQKGYKAPKGTKTTQRKRKLWYHQRARDVHHTSEENEHDAT